MSAGATILDTGYLSKLETARVNKVIADYPLFPAGRAPKGGIVAVSALEPRPPEMGPQMAPLCRNAEPIWERRFCKCLRSIGVRTWSVSGSNR